MSEWTNQELTKLERAEEIRIAPQRRDGTSRDPTVIWVVRHGNALYVRSVRGRDGHWFRGVQETHRGRVLARGIEKEVAFEDAEPDVNDEIDAAYRAKYRQYAGRVLNSVLTPKARSTTIKVVPRTHSR